MNVQISNYPSVSAIFLWTSRPAQVLSKLEVLTWHVKPSCLFGFLNALRCVRRRLPIGKFTIGKPLQHQRNCR